MTKKKLHILFLNSWYPSKVLPNNGDFIQRHAEAVARNHQVTAVHAITDHENKDNEIDDFYLNGVRTLIFYLKPSKLTITKQIIFFKAYKKLIYLSGKFDMVHVNRLFPVGIVAVWLKIFKSKPFIISEHFTGYLNEGANKISKTELLISKIITNQASFVCPVSDNLANNMLKIGLAGNYYSIPNVVDIEMFIPIKKDNKTLTLIHLSSLLDSHKNVTGILNVISKLQNHIPNFLFYLIGENSNKYKELIISLKINPKIIKLFDQIPHHQVPEYLQKSDILILFSNYENLPCVILEAFACGTKVISTDVGGINEFFPDSFGDLIPIKDEKKLLNSLIKLNKKSENLLKKEMHQYASDNFSKKKISNEFSNLYYKSLNLNQE
ncbi:MAG: glycosyltransferase family 4 protein [Flavobacteriaceae bacterium]|nr:glycosyltransferase family 4 protein [Flavobacteriaceae bacterium]